MEETAPKFQQAPAMDVVAPRGAAPESVAVEPAPPPEEGQAKDSQAPAKGPKEKPKAQKPAKKPRNGVGMAIFATMVIVLGLAAMATYAYIKTQN